MAAYLGPSGALTQIRCASQIHEEDATPITYRTSISRVRYAQVVAAHKTNRTWDVSWSEATTPEMVAYVRQISMGGYGLTPLVYYSEQAAANNILTPQETMFAPGTYQSPYSQGGAVVASVESSSWDGRLLRTLTTATQDRLLVAGRIPVPAGVPYTVSAYLTAYDGVSARLSVAQRDAADRWVREDVAQTDAGAGLQRVHLTVHPSERTTQIQIQTIGALRVAGLAVSLTPGPVPWTDGQGCRSALVSRPSAQPYMMAIDPSITRRSAYGFTVTEVG